MISKKNPYKRWLIVPVLLFICIGFCFPSYAAQQVPPVVGLSLDDARAELKAAGFICVDELASDGSLDSFIGFTLSECEQILAQNNLRLIVME